MAYNNVNNWLWSPFIDRGSANRLYIEIQFTIRDCSLFPGNALSCKETFSLLFYEFDAATREPPPWQPESYKLIGKRFQLQIKWKFIVILALSQQSIVFAFVLNYSTNCGRRRKIQSKFRCRYQYGGEEHCSDEKGRLFCISWSRRMHQCISGQSVLHHVPSNHWELCTFQWDTNRPWDHNHRKANGNLCEKCRIKRSANVFVQRWWQMDDFDERLQV